ncbi:MAG: response regulator [Candidatus Sericytochromatia bacterium]|nr:response regulator [Candidatus Sericytochromatia bacterium]
MAATALITDDSPTIRNMIAFTLKAIGLNTVEAVDGQEALNKLEAGNIDILIVDLNMPKINGLELIGILRKNPKFKKLPMIMVTTETDKKKGMTAGANEYLIKPFKPQELQAIVKNYITIKAP